MQTSAQVETADLKFVGLVRHHRNNSLTRKNRTFLESIPRKAEHFWNQFRKKPNIFGKSPLNRSVVASNGCTRKFCLGQNNRISAKMMPLTAAMIITRLTTTTPQFVRHVQQVRPVRPHRNNPLTPKYFSNTHLAIMQKNSPAGSKICDSHAGEFLGCYVFSRSLCRGIASCGGFTSW